MIGRLVVRFTLFLLKNSRISIEDRLLCTNSLISKLQALPTHDIIAVDPSGNIRVNGRELDREGARKLREGSLSILQSSTRELVRQQVVFRAINLALHNGDTPEKMIFGRAAIWWSQQEDELYELLAGQGGE